ncbi:malto-oligosyltrehalose trehalohydrolase [Anaeromyxobacter oryzae]|uniref:Malto-oligosyltrehalose trehalohydrolase n=2 Tax=Anaeromyxobacter oryzae TaxID=2918170 RepID=A0ABN6MNL3_9BACT|nr:malto-oligosyltrehalose trehalohydrolase [Anaeromyxobacter oryzae]
MRARSGGTPPRRLAAGAEVLPDGVHFRVWAPACARLEVIVESGAPGLYALAPEPGGWFSGLVRGLAAGARYRYRLDGGDALPDPASRRQPEGPHGASEVVDPNAFRWTDAEWKGLAPEGQVLYELHVGTFTPEGTFEAASRELLALARLGITAVEVMPVAEFSGAFGWGYDGVDPYAPSHLYGSPDDLRRFVDRAHAVGLGVLLDVVYNHFGPDGCYLARYSPAYFTKRYAGEWGDPLNFDGEDAGPARAFVADNAAYWISEFHLDGLRLDATQSLFDASDEHILSVIAARARDAAGPRRILLVAENEPQDARLVRPREAGGRGLDLAWNDDFHHSAVVAATGRREAYYADHAGTPQELISAAKHGYLFQGQHYRWQGKRRGRPTRGIPPRAFVAYLENHDQVANSARGERLHERTDPGRWRALTTLLLLGPWTPLLFQGEEHASSRPFLYFADQAGELAHGVREGRAAFLRQFQGIDGPDMRDRVPDPGARATFERCRLEATERSAHREPVALHRDLLDLRRSDPVLRAQGADGLDGAVLAAEAFCLRFSSPRGRDRLLVVNLGAGVELAGAAEPLLAPPEDGAWRLVFSSEDPRYGGSGTPALDETRFRVPGHSALLLAPAPGADLG